MKKSDNNKYFWLIIHPYVYISIKNKQFLMLNTLNKQYIKSGDLELFSIVKCINLKKNGYVIELSNIIISDNIKVFINEIRYKFIGDIIDSTLSNGKPVQFYPELNLERIQEEMTYKVKASKLLKTDVVKGFIKEISIYINSLCHQNCSFCSSAYLQFENCFKTANKCNLSISYIKRIINGLNGSSLENVKILGGNILLHPEFKNIVEYFEKIPISKEYYLNYLNIITHPNEVKSILNKANALNISVHFPVNKKIFREMYTLIKNGKYFPAFRFIIEAENQYEESEKISKEFNLKNTQIIPYYNKNLKFFEENVFLTEKSIIEGNVSLNQIFVNQSLNQKNFKKITITSDKMVFANLNHSSLGRVDNNLMDLIVYEINNGKSWFNTRNKVKPCNSCLFQDVCPPISNYEYFMGRYNVCKKNKETKFIKGELKS